MARTRDGFSDMDWDKLKVFHAAAEAGSFTHAGEQLGLSQSAVSRQVSALEQELSVSLFHRHARGLILTEQGDLLFRTAHDVFMQLQAARAKLTDSRERPSGDLKITTPPALGINWLIPRLHEFTALYPEIRISMIVTDEDLDLSMREADVASPPRFNGKSGFPGGCPGGPSLGGCASPPPKSPPASRPSPTSFSASCSR